MLQVSNEGATLLGSGISLQCPLSISMTLFCSVRRIFILLLLITTVLVRLALLKWCARTCVLATSSICSNCRKTVAGESLSFVTMIRSGKASLQVRIAGSGNRASMHTSRGVAVEDVGSGTDAFRNKPDTFELGAGTVAGAKACSIRAYVSLR